MSLPLAGRRVLVTRAAHQAGKLSDRLRALGAEPVEVPVLEIRPPESYHALDQALQHIREYDWLIFTSSNTVRALLDRATETALPIPAGLSAKIAAVGAATAAELESHGIPVTFVPVSYVSESLIAHFPDPISGKRILLARASIARDVIPAAFQAAGASLDVADAYRNVLPDNAPEKLRAALGGKIDAATFTSSSTVSHLAEAAAISGIRFPIQGVPAISIGPVTSQTLREHGWEPAIEADPHDIAGLMDALVRALERKTPTGSK